jgi:Zn ribbon nucleic-acid-binding protein
MEQLRITQKQVIASADPACIAGNILRVHKQSELNLIECTQGSLYTTRQHDCTHKTCILFSEGKIKVTSPNETPV